MSPRDTAFGPARNGGSAVPPREEILQYVLKTMEDLSRDWDYSRPVGPDSMLFTELGYESLDAVVLCTAIQEHYHRQMPFPELLAALGRERRDLSIRELVDFIEQHLQADDRVEGMVQ